MLFGIAALTAVGLSWTIVGIVMGRCPKRGVPPETVQFFGALISVLASLVILVCVPETRTDGNAWIWAGVSYFCGGALNFLLLQGMSYAMQRGPNGIIWTIIQSAMIFPFLTGILFFGVELSIFRAAGMGMILTALIAFGLSKDNSGGNRSGGGEGGWRLAAFGAFLIAGVQQNLATLPSYFPEGREISSIAKTLMTSFGVFFAALLWSLRGFNRAKAEELKKTLKSKYLWIYVGALQFFSLIFAYLLFYPGLDALANAGAGAISYPILIGSCIVGFFLYGVTVLKEKMSLPQVAAFLLCLGGIAGICIQTKG